MIREGNPQAIASRAHAIGELDILPGWSWIPRGVVMPGQSGGGSKAEGFAEELPRADEAGGGGAVGQDAVSEKIAFCVKCQHPETLFGPALDFGQQVGPCGARGADAWAVEPATGAAAVNLLKDGKACHLGLGESKGLKFSGSHGHQTAKTFGLVEYFFGATGTGAVQHGFDDLGVGKGFGTIEGDAFGDGKGSGCVDLSKNLLVEEGKAGRGHGVSPCPPGRARSAGVPRSPGLDRERTGHRVESG